MRGRREALERIETLTAAAEPHTPLRSSEALGLDSQTAEGRCKLPWDEFFDWLTGKWADGFLPTVSPGRPEALVSNSPHRVQYLRDQNVGPKVLS